MVTVATIQALIQYNAHQLYWHQLENHEDLRTLTQTNLMPTTAKNVMTWLDLQGEISEQRWQQLVQLGWFDQQAIARAIELYQLHRQRPSIEEYPQSLVIIFRMVSLYTPNDPSLTTIDRSADRMSEAKLTPIPRKTPLQLASLDSKQAKNIHSKTAPQPKTSSFSGSETATLETPSNPTSETVVGQSHDPINTPHYPVSSPLNQSPTQKSTQYPTQFNKQLSPPTLNQASKATNSHQFPELNLALDIENSKTLSQQSQEWSEGCGFRSQQVSFVVSQSCLISVQEYTDYDSFELVRDQLRVHQSLLCDRGVDYLIYALIDATIDSFFPVLEQYGERIALLEDEVVLRPTPKTLKKIYRLRRDLLELRRAVWPQRHVVNLLSRGSGNQIISDMVRACFRDAYDRLMQVLEMIESYRELTSGLMDIYLSALSQKTNEVMKTLTIISTIFIPLTFVAGVYGMNFNTDRSPWNMPELNWYWGYPLCWAIMLTIASGSVIFFWRRGWFENLSDWHDLPPSDPS